MCARMCVHGPMTALLAVLLAGCADSEPERPPAGLKATSPAGPEVVEEPGPVATTDGVAPKKGDILFEEVHRGMVQVEASTDPTGVSHVTRDQFLAVAAGKAEQIAGKAIYRCSVNYSGQAIHRLYVRNGVLIAEVNKYAHPHGRPPAPPEGKRYRYDIYLAVDLSIKHDKAKVKYAPPPPERPDGGE